MMNFTGVLRLFICKVLIKILYSFQEDFRWYDMDLYSCAEMTKLLALKAFKVAFRSDLQRLIKNRS